MDQAKQAGRSGMSPLRFGFGLDRQSRPTNRHDGKETDRFKSFIDEELIKRDKRSITHRTCPAS